MERRIEWHAKDRQLCQIPKEGLEYAWVSEDYKQIHQLVWCKDFMQDAIFGFLNKKRTLIYGFEYDPDTYQPLCMKQTRLIVANWKDPDFADHLHKNCIPFLHGIEAMLKMRKTKVEKCLDPPARYKKCGIYLLDGSKRWMHSPPMISLYTLLIRVGFVHDPQRTPMETLTQIRDRTIKAYNWKPGNEDDADFVTKGLPGINRILKEGDRKIFHRKMEQNYPPVDKTGVALSVYTMHDNCGVVGFSQGYTKSTFPNWHKN